MRYVIQNTVQVLRDKLGEKVTAYHSISCPVPSEEVEARNNLGLEIKRLQGFHPLFTRSFYDCSVGGGAS